MFGNLGFMEMLVIFAIALVVFGPRRLPEIARTIGRALGQFRRATSDLQNTVEREIQADEIRRSVDEVRSLAESAERDAMRSAADSTPAAPAPESSADSPPSSGRHSAPVDDSK